MKRAVKILLLLALLLVGLALSVWLYRYFNPSEINADREDENTFTLKIPESGGWYATDVWVKTYYTVSAEAEQPFTLAVDGVKDDADLQDNEKFQAVITVVPYFLPYKDLAQAENQGRVYFYADKSIRINFRRRRLDPSDIERLDKEYQNRQAGDNQATEHARQAEDERARKLREGVAYLFRLWLWAMAITSPLWVLFFGIRMYQKRKRRKTLKKW